VLVTDETLTLSCCFGVCFIFAKICCLQNFAVVSSEMFFFTFLCKPNSVGSSKCIVWCRSDGEKGAIGLARLEKACDPSASEGASFACDVEAMDSSDNEVCRHVHNTA